MEKEQMSCIEASSVDRISDLPDGILHQILSYLPTEVVARTCVLSKRWQYLWDTYPIFDIPRLSFLVIGEGVDIDRYADVVDHKLNTFCKYEFEIQKFKLSFMCELNGIKLKHDSLVNKWLRLVAERNVKELHLDFGIRDRSPCSFPQEIFAAKSLTFLEIHCPNALLPSSINLPSLETLRLSLVCIPEGFKLSCHQLKVLTINYCCQFGKIEIFAPNLSSMCYYSNLLPTSSFLSLDGPSILKEFMLSSVRFLNTLWYTKLKESLLHMHNGTETLVLLLDADKKNTFDRGEASKRCISPQYALKCLVLNLFHPTMELDLEALIDGFLWSFRPEILRVMFSGPNKKGFAEVLFKMLEAIEAQGCCSSSEIKCWRHSCKVKHVLVIAEGFEEKLPLSRDALSKVAYDHQEIRQVEFYLTW
ncbi:hypothetical protein SLEP1_g21365 [Rubroshorea leprosula]|uniref:F-box domain-containing protein n=1 Tax=Rubroshorea leprosula TaxID=152421 RepID=A0AAV5JEG4_9ROSI|nr:hypothetical protein SLEP1_g21365 [Rubroshorea leprosula]